MHRLLFVLTLFLLASFAHAAEPLTPAQIAQNTYDRYLGDDMKLRGTMDLISKNGRVRNREFLSFRKDGPGERKMLIRFTRPVDIDGTAFLTLETDHGGHTEQHLYLPALKRTRRIVASQKGRSFVNSDFTYEDMQRHPVEAWEYQLDGDETVTGYSCYILTSTPKPGTSTQYSKVITWIEKENFIPLKIDFWNKKEQKAKSYKVLAFAVIDGVATETEVLMEDLLSGHKTRLKSMGILYNTGLKDSLFTPRSLER